MKYRALQVGAVFSLFYLFHSTAAVLYVNVNGTNPTPPFSDWSTAATDIQSAVDAASDGDQILVTNGIYQTGGRTADGATLTNRVLINKAVTVQSVNGPTMTTIQGYQVPGSINGDAAVRCVYMGGGASLIGFTLSGGATRTDDASGGGAVCQDYSCVLSNCVLIGNSALGVAGGVEGGIVENCLIVSNACANVGGGTYNSFLTNCLVAGNYAAVAGGGIAAYQFWYTDISANYCVITGNSSSNYAGGIFGGVLVYCTLTNNITMDSTGDSVGGGADSTALYATLVSGNTADYGGGAENCDLYECVVTGNYATQSGGGVQSCYVENCSVAANSAGGGAGGADASQLYNCIAYFNTASSNANYSPDTCTINSSCTTPLPGGGLGNLGSDPLFVNLSAGDSHLQSDSPCINAGNNSYVNLTNDFEGKPRIIGLIVDMGAYEFPTPVAITANITNVAVGFPVQFTSQVYAGSNSSFIIDFGDGTQVTNQLSPTHSWAAPGDYVVTLTAFSDSYPGGVSQTIIIHVVQGIYYVAAESTNPIAPFTSWDTAATNIQDAVAAAVFGGTIVVSNGTYSTGGSVVYGALTNRVAVTKPLSVRSVNGPGVTIIQGYQMPGTNFGDGAIRCAYLTNGCQLIGFTLTGGATRNGGDAGTEQSGGGLWCEDSSAFISNCIISGDAANNVGGGAYRGKFFNCTISGNSAEGNGGGLSSASLNNCSITGNSSFGNGGGADSCTASNCVFSVNISYFGNIFVGGAGGGANGCILSDCTFTGNQGYGGGGARSSTLYHCLIESNSVSGENCGGAGIENSIASDCTIINNYSEDVGGGVDYSALTNCLVAGNRADGDGGGYWGGFGYYTLNNCLVISNSAGGMGGGVNDANLYDCTVVGNSAAQGGGVSDCSVYNCIISDNDAGYQANHVYSYFENTCTTPLPIPNENGPGNFAADPQLADAYHLTAGSPCRGAGNPVYAFGVDFDGLAWGSPPSIGCDEYHATAVTGPLTDSIQANFTNVATGFMVSLTAQITGHSGSNHWDFGDGTAATNQPFTSHTWSAPGAYTVTLTAYNGSNPGGVSTTTTIHIVTPPVHYVALTSVNPVAPFTSWDTAATSIQDAVDASIVPGALILVSNGVYSSGGQIVYGILSNRVAVTKPVTLQSVNGAAATVIQGNPMMGDSGVRCLWLTNGSALRGFTVTQGATRANGNEPREISAGGVWCQSLGVVVSDCTFVSNSASFDGGGITGGSVSNCTFIGNSCGDSGGAGAGGIYYNCVFRNNSAIGAGGVWDAIVNNSYFIGNEANVPWSDFGGGTYEGVLNNCVLRENVADGAATSLLNNCTLVANVRGGAESCTLNNCIAFHNIDGNGAVYNYSPDSTLNYCCTIPLPTNGVSNISADPKLSFDSVHLTAGSPCIAAGSAAYTTGFDIDGEPWANPPSIGCDEYHTNATGSLSVSIQAAFTNVAPGFTDSFAAELLGHSSIILWNFGDGTTVSNQLAPTHAWRTLGDYTVTLTAYNDDNLGGVSASVTVHVTEGNFYVAQGNLNPVPPYNSWATAATNIQDAADIAPAGGSIFVGDGDYQFGGNVADGVSNRVAAVVPLMIQSVDGPALTVIDGGAAMRCVYLTSGSLLSGFTLTNGAAGSQNGGGVDCESLTATITNCVIAGNSANSGGGASLGTLNNCVLAGNLATVQGFGGGGGANGSALNNCILTNNSATAGGGADGCTLNNCLLVGNRANQGWFSASGGGANGGTLINCTVVGNSTDPANGGGGGGTRNSKAINSIIVNNGPDNFENSSLGYCCTGPTPSAPIDDAGNFAADPAFVSGFHLQSNSPCINAGHNAEVTITTDLDGNPRIVGGTVDIGAYEYQTPTSILSYAWLEQYGLPIDGSADFADTDGTGMNNWQKWIAGLNPIDPNSVFVMLPPAATNSPGVTVTWKSVNTRTYYLQRAGNLAAKPAFTTIQSNLVGQPGTTSYTDTSATNGGPYFYRVGVQ